MTERPRYLLRELVIKYLESYAENLRCGRADGHTNGVTKDVGIYFVGFRKSVTDLLLHDISREAIRVADDIVRRGGALA
jgi:hypothetical protein